MKKYLLIGLLALLSTNIQAKNFTDKDIERINIEAEDFIKSLQKSSKKENDNKIEKQRVEKEKLRKKKKDLKLEKEKKNREKEKILRKKQEKENIKKEEEDLLINSILDVY